MDQHNVQHNQDEDSDSEDRHVDRMEINVPLLGSFRVSGRQVSALFLCVGIGGIILAFGYAIANIIGAYRG